MKHLILALFTLLFSATNVCAQLTLERCQQLAQENYPAIKKYGLMEKSLDIELSDINKSVYSCSHNQYIPLTQMLLEKTTNNSWSICRVDLFLVDNNQDKE